jgi:ADP-heptose:LPS heptosyltransferase
MMGIPTLALFGPTDPTIWGPRGAKVQIISTEEADTLHPGERKEVLLSRMDQIKPEMVMERLAPILG